MKSSIVLQRNTLFVSWEEMGNISFDLIVASAPSCLKKTSSSIGLFSQNAEIR